MPRDSQEALAKTIEDCHTLLDRVGIPKAETGTVCDDPDCQSKLYHRIKSLIADKGLLPLDMEHDKGNPIVTLGQLRKMDDLPDDTPLLDEATYSGGDWYDSFQLANVVNVDAKPSPISSSTFMVCERGDKKAIVLKSPAPPRGKMPC